MLVRERYIEVPLIMIPNMAMEVLFDSFVPPRFEYGRDAIRRPVDQYPYKALRELIVNAIVHRDYSVEEPVTVSVFPDRLEVFCFGMLPEGWTLEMLKQPHPSRPRNISIARVFHDAGYFENWAQGIRMVMDLCRENGNPEPDFDMRIDGLVATMYPVVEEVPSQVMQQVVLTRKQEEIIAVLRDDPFATASRIGSLVGLGERSVYQKLNEMVDMGVIVKSGSRKRRQYIVCLDEDRQ